MSQEKPGGAKKPQKTRRNQEEPGTWIFLRSAKRGAWRPLAPPWGP